MATDDDPPGWVPLAAWALLETEREGLAGGGLQCPGAGTERHEAFRELGKGRRNASDGGAWTEAIRAAAGEMEVELGASIVPGLDPPRLLAICKQDSFSGPEEVDLLRLLTPEQAAVYVRRRIIALYNQGSDYPVTTWAIVLDDLLARCQRND